MNRQILFYPHFLFSKIIHVTLLYVTYIYVTYILYIYKDDDEKRSIEHVIRNTTRNTYDLFLQSFSIYRDVRHTYGIRTTIRTNGGMLNGQI